MFEELVLELKKRGADFVCTADISSLSKNENQGYPSALLIGMALSPGYLMQLAKSEKPEQDEFGEKESCTDRLAEWAADFIVSKGYRAFAQSEKVLLEHGMFDETTKTTPLPHKKSAVLAGLGWIGKNNLLVTGQYGCGVSLCTLLTDAPVGAERKQIMQPQCGGCTSCRDICPAGVIHGSTWGFGVGRDEIVDVYHCITCLKCMAVCPWTQKYVKINLPG